MRKTVWFSILLLCSCPRPSPGQGQESARVEVKRNPAADDALARALHVQESSSRRAAIEALLAVRRDFPESTAGQEALYRSGMLAYEEGDYATARKALGELVYENPLYPRADTARLKMALASLEMHAYQDAYQTLSTLVERLEGGDRRVAEEALAKAASGAHQFGEALKIALKQVESAESSEAIQSALAALEEVVETKTTYVAITEALQDMPTSHRAWPLLTFKLARILFHLRDMQRVDETLKSLLANAPNSPYSTDAQALLSRANRRATVKPRAVGAVLPMTGKYKAFGEAALRGIQLGLKGTTIELVVKDNQGDASQTAKLVDQLAYDEGVIAIVGPLLSDDARRAALVAEEDQVPLITMTRAEDITAIGPNIFRTMVTNSQQAEALAEYSTSVLGLKTFAMLYPSTPFGNEMANAFWTAVEQRGGEIHGVETYAHDQKTFTDETKRLVGRYYLEDRPDYFEKVREIREKKLDEFRLRKALEKARSGVEPIVDFEALLIPDSWQQVSLIAPALAVEDIITNACDKKDIERIQKTTGKDKIKTVTLLGPSTWSSPKGTSGDPMLLERGGKYVQCSVYVDGFFEGSERAATKAFVRDFREANGEAPISILDAVGYDTAGIVRSLIDKARVQTRTAFRDKLATLKDFQGATGAISFDTEREAKRSLFFLNVTAKGIKELNPTQRPEG